MEKEKETRQHRFSKEERLCRQKAIDSLFQHGRSFVSFPIRIVWTKKPLIATNSLHPGDITVSPEKENQSEPAVHILVAVSTKSFKRAVDRNLLKRRMRESYRLHKDALYNAMKGQDFSLDLACQFIGKEISDYHEIDEKLVFALHFLIRQLEKPA